MQLKPLYTVRFFYPDGWETTIDGSLGKEEEHFYLGEGVCEGTISGKFRGANHPRRRADGTFLMNFQGFIETQPAKSIIMFDYQGYGRTYPKGRRQVVGTAKHYSQDEKYRWLNDSICVISGEVRAPIIPPEQIKQADVKLVFTVAELLWEAPPP
jgi:hypothetical protein